jgi:two-component system cell cycle sensor histidine kinase/response regulator CckA
MSRRPKKQIAAGVSSNSSTELYQVLFEQAADGMFITDAQGRFVEVNRRGCEMLGYTHEEMLHLSWQDLVPAEDVARAPLDELRTGKALLEEGWLRCKDGHLLPIEISVRMLSGGGLLGVARDIGKRTNAERELHQSNDLLRAIIEAAPTGIFGLDLDGNVQMVWNPAAEKMLGWSAQEAMGRPLPSVPAESQEEFRGFREKIRRGLTLDGVEVRRQRRDGSPIDYNIYASPLYDAESQITGNVAVIVDITERKRVQSIMQARLRLLEFASSHLMDELLTATLDEIEALTGSTIGFYHFLEADQRTLSLQNWSTNTLKSMCMAEGKGSHYDVAQAGVWVDCVHQRRPVVHNDYASLPHRKGMPEGHAPVIRELVVPIFRGNLIKAIIGVGNKSTNYDESDIEIVSQLGDLSWDIAERKRAEAQRAAALSQREAALAALKEQYSTLRGIIDSANALVFSVDRQYCYTSFNAGHAAVMAALYGAEIEIGHSLLDYMTVTEDRVTAKGNLDRALAGEHLVREAYSGEELRSRRYFQVSHSPIKTEAGEVIGVAILAQDMTERRQAEEELRKLSHAVEQSANIIIITDAQGTIEYANPKFTDITGYTLEEARGQHTRILKSGYTPPEEYKRLWETITAGKEWHGEFHNKKKNGEPYWESASISPIKNADGIITHFLAVKEDITERKQAEAAQAHLEEQLRQAQRMECVGRLASGVAHDFNNLLTVIRGYCELVRTNMPVGDPRIGDLEQIRQASERAAGLTRQLLAFSRQQVLATADLDLNDLVTNLRKMLGRLIGEDITLSTILQPGLWSITADPGQIEQVIMNLAANARDAMPTGGKLTIATGNVRLDESYAQTHLEAPTGPCVMLTVTDTGQGMDKPTQARIFEPFFSTKEPDKGTGLGLATVYGIVKQSGGDITVYSEPGQGTVFKIYLPASEAALKGPVMPPPHPSVKRGGHETILLVEDDKGVRELVRIALQYEGYTVLEADSGGEALSLVGRHQGQIDLLMTDVVMPHMNGRELAERLKALYPQIRVLFMSGYTDDTMVRHGVLAAEIKFLPKPFSPITLTSKVREVLDEPI